MDWNNIEFFDMENFDDPLYPGSGENIDPLIALVLDSLRRNTGWPIRIHTSVGGAVDMHGDHGHADGSYHLLKNGCKAADWHFVTDTDYRLQYRAVEKMGFNGIGSYLGHWRWNGKILPIGFHTDLRPKGLIQRWSCRKKGEYFYLL